MRFHFFLLNLQSLVILTSKHVGVFSSCTNASEVLKIHVGKPPLQDENHNVVEDTATASVNALHETLSARSKQATHTVEGWAKEWHKEKTC